MGVGEAKENKKVLESAVADLEKIAGQKAVVTRAKKSVANFKLREGMPIGCKVTLRGERMYEFADRLINLALPRGNAKLIKRSANSYILSPRNVTLHPIGIPSLNLKFATDFFALVTTAFCPAIFSRSATADSKTFLFSFASPTPMLITIFS